MVSPEPSPAAAPPDSSSAAESLDSTSKPSSLFPLFPVSSTTLVPTSSISGGDSPWLSNPSFTFDASSLPPPPSTSHPPQSPGSDEEPSAAAPARYDLVPSSPSPAASSDEGSRSKRKERRRRKRKREKEKEGFEASRKSGVRAWAGSDTKPAKDYYFDAKGDRDNLAFGCLYRMDIARYKPQSIAEVPGLNYFIFHHWRRSASSVGVDADLDGLDSKVRAGGRYYSVKYATLERNKGFKHLKVSKNEILDVVPEQFIPLEPPSHPENHGNATWELEESWEDELLRRTRELNKMSRESPHDEKVWLAFVEFQDKIASSQPQKAARLQTIERKISILEKAVELNPENEELLLCLLRSYGDRDSTENLLEKWEKILMQHSDSCRLWKEYLLICQGEFSQFKVSEMRKRYAYAIQALSAACNKLCRQDDQNADCRLPNSSLVQLELGLVDIFVNLCRFEWQTGYRELATGLFQAQMEYSLFCPTLHLTPSSKQRLFEHFWNSGSARIGEDGALGWSTWLAKDEENRQNMFMQESSQEVEVGGWSGWFDPSSEEKRMHQVLEESVEPSIIDGNDEDNPDAEGNQAEDDIESLMRKLGIDIDAESNSEVKDAKTWNRWCAEELSRDSEQWMPLHENSASLCSDGDLVQEDNEQLSRVILFEDVTEYLFSLSSEEARFSLICQFIDFYGGKISQWASTNSSSWFDKILSLESIPDHILEDLRVVSDLANNIQNSSQQKLESLLGSTNDLLSRTAMMKFLRNVILLCLDIFPRNHILEESVLVTAELSMTQENSLSNSVNASRTLAKTLLKKDRQDFLLCGIYARIEATHGNIDQARKIFDMALLSIEGVTKQDLQEKIPLLYFWYAEMEMATSTSGSNAELSVQRAIYILSCLGSNIKYAPFTCPISRPQILRAHLGFKEQIRSLRCAFVHGGVKEYSIALICSAALFETMTSGCSTGIEVIEEALSMALPERRSHGLEFERLWVYYIRLLQKHLSQLSFLRIWRSISQGMQVYPYNPKSLTAMLTLSCLYSVSNKVRLTLDKCSKRNPSVVLWLFSLSFEWSKAGSDNRIHGLFERALSDDKLQKSVLLWRCYLAYEAEIACNPTAARRVFFRAVHACPWSKRLWLDGFQKLSSFLTLKELSDLQEVMRDKELNIRTDIYEILLQDEIET